jgi:hypothetical protein
MKHDDIQHYRRGAVLRQSHCGSFARHPLCFCAARRPDAATFAIPNLMNLPRTVIGCGTSSQESKMSLGPDKVGRPTGPGDGSFLVTDQDLPHDAVMEYIITNFNIDGNLLKPEHKDFLDQHVLPFVRANKVHVELTGTASQTGGAAYDRELSRERAARVRQYLLAKGLNSGQVPINDMHAAGKDLSKSKNVEDEFDRAVRIRIVIGVRKVHVLPHIVVPQISPPQAPPQEVPETIIVVDTRVPWAIQELTGFNVAVGASVGGFGAGIGLQAGTVEYHFLLVNSRTKQMSQCRFFGGAGGGGVGPGPIKPGPSIGPSFSMTQGSHTWDQFVTPAGKGFDDFAGTAIWKEAGAGLGSTISAARLTCSNLGLTISVTTGATIGTPGALISAGNFFLKPPVQLQL